MFEVISALVNGKTDFYFLAVLHYWYKGPKVRKLASFLIANSAMLSHEIFMSTTNWVIYRGLKTLWWVQDIFQR